jgi:hypothetical protein
MDITKNSDKCLARRSNIPAVHPSIVSPGPQISILGFRHPVGTLLWIGSNATLSSPRNWLLEQALLLTILIGPVGPLALGKLPGLANVNFFNSSKK